MALLVLMLALATTVCASTQTVASSATQAEDAATGQLASSLVRLVDYVAVLDAESPKLASAEEIIESLEHTSPSAVNVEAAVVQGGPLNTEAVIIEHSYSSLESAIAEIDLAEQSNPGLFDLQSTLEHIEATMASLLTDVSEYEAEVTPSFAAATNELAEMAEKYPSALTLVSYIDAVELTEPSVISAEAVIQQLKQSSPLLLSYVNLVRSQPSALTDTSYFDSIEDKYPSLFSALAELSVADQIHSTFSTVMSTVERLDTWFPNLLTVVQTVQDVISPSTMHMVSELESLESSYPSLDDYLRGTIQYDTDVEMSMSMNMNSNAAQPIADTTADSVIESVEQTHPSLPSLLSSMEAFTKDVYLQAQSMPAKKCSSMQVDVEVLS